MRGENANTAGTSFAVMVVDIDDLAQFQFVSVSNFVVLADIVVSNWLKEITVLIFIWGWNDTNESKRINPIYY